MPQVKPEDRLTTEFCRVVNRHEDLARLAWRMFLPGSRRSPGLFDAHPDELLPSKPDILLKDHDGKIRGYVEAKVSSTMQPLQLIRGKSWAGEVTRRNVPVIALVKTPTKIPKVIGIRRTFRWFKTVTWNEVLGEFERHLAGVDRRKSVQRDFKALRRCARSVGSLSTINKIDYVNEILSEWGMPYGNVLEEVARRLKGYTCHFVCRASSPPSLHVGQPEWREVFGCRDFQRLYLPYSLTRYPGIKYQAFRFILALWHQTDHAASDISWETRRAWLEKALKWSGGQVETGRRKHHQRDHHKERFPERVMRAKVGLLRDLGGEIKIVPADVESKERQEVLADKIVARVHTLDRFIMSLERP